MFKKGDKVICVDYIKTAFDLENSIGGWKKNKIFTINVISSFNGHQILWPKDITSGVWSHHVKLYIDKEEQYKMYLKNILNN